MQSRKYLDSTNRKNFVAFTCRIILLKYVLVECKDICMNNCLLFLQDLFFIISIIISSKKIENLEHCPKLDTLNLSHNYIKAIEDCDSSILPLLNTLNLSHNALGSMKDLEGLVNCKKLSVLDLSHNRIDDIWFVKILSQMAELRVLTLTGNPVINQIPAYRKTLIIECVSNIWFNNEIALHLQLID